jgi:septation ring formation regulator EzrA
MTNPVNLNKARKEKARDRSRREADANSAKYGQSKAQKDLIDRRLAALREKLDQHRVAKSKGDADT